MKHEITHGPSFAVLRVNLQPGEVLTAESGAMVSRSARVRMQTRLNAPRSAGFFGKLGAFLTALIRKLIAGESLMINDFLADEGGEALLAPTFSGAIAHKRLDGGRLLLTRGAFLASSGNLELTMRWGGLRGLLAREGVFFLEVSGTGDLFYTSYGGTLEVPVNGKLVVDNGHIVAFDPALDFNIRAAGGGVMGFLASGEGLVCEFSGRGSVILQSRNVSALVSWLTPRLPG
jgi:uncharacterized protein (TIGR00266 family)